MLIKILYSLLLPTFLVVPFLYRNKRPAMLDFYYDMAMSFAFRKVYMRMLLLFLLAFHFYHLTIFRNHYDLIPSSVLCFAVMLKVRLQLAVKVRWDMSYPMRRVLKKKKRLYVLLVI